MKKLLSILMAVVLVFSLCAPTAFADGDKLHVGDTFAVAVTTGADVSGVSTVTCRITFDKSIVQVQGYFDADDPDSGDFFSDLQGHRSFGGIDVDASNTSSGAIGFVDTNTKSAMKIAGGSTLLTVTFKVIAETDGSPVTLDELSITSGGVDGVEVTNITADASPSSGSGAVLRNVVTEKATVDVTAVTAEPETVELAKVGDTAELTVTVEPKDATDKTVTFESGDESIVTVDDKGVITAVGEGNTTVTVKAGDKTATVTVTVAHTHVAGEEWKSDGTQHWHECTAGDGEKMDSADHSGGTATCTAKAVCEVCGAEYGDLAAHDLSKTEGKDPTHLKEGNIPYWTCSVCGKIFSDAEGKSEISQEQTVLPKTTAHEFNGWTPVDENQHQRVCGCGVIEKADHSFELVSETPATCKAEGNKHYQCKDCGFEKDETVEKTAHQFSKPETTKEPTCTEPGISTGTCSICGDTTEQPIPALGHDWGEVTYTWAADNSSCTAEMVCKRDASHKETETVTAAKAVTTPASCEQDGVTTYTATFTKEGFSVQTKTVNEPAQSGHNWGAVTYTWSADNSSCTAERVCQNDASHKETETVTASSADTTPATCEGAGVRTLTATFTNSAFAAQTKTVEIDALGHKWDAGIVTTQPTCTLPGVKTITCQNDGSHVKTEPVDALGHDWGEWAVTPATCEQDGVQTRVCSRGDATESVPLTKLGHDWGDPTYTWSADNSSCTAEMVCKRDASHKETETVTAAKEVTTPATCEANGVTTLTATFTKEGFSVQTKTLEEPAATDHDWGEPTYTWSADNKTCTAERVCKNDASHKETETVTAAETVKTQPTCEEKGQADYKASFTNAAFTEQSKTGVELPAKGHDYDGGVCKNDPSHLDPAFEPKIIKMSDNGVAYRDNPFEVTANMAFSTFTAVEIDGATVPNANYSAKAGSTVVTFTPAYINTLKPGTHTVTVNSRIGNPSATFTVSDKVKTGDEGRIGLWLGLMLISVMAVGGIVTVDYKRRVRGR